MMENADRFYAIECPFELTDKKQISMQELNIGNPITFGLAHRVGRLARLKSMASTDDGGA